METGLQAQASDACDKDRGAETREEMLCPKWGIFTAEKRLQGGVGCSSLLAVITTQCCRHWWFQAQGSEQYFNVTQEIEAWWWSNNWFHQRRWLKALAVIQEWRGPVPEHREKVYLYIYAYTWMHTQNIIPTTVSYGETLTPSSKWGIGGFERHQKGAPRAECALVSAAQGGCRDFFFLNGCVFTTIFKIDNQQAPSV